MRVLVLDWFCDHCSKEDQDTLGLPAIRNGRQFRDRFDWIKGRWKTATQPKKPRNRGPESVLDPPPEYREEEEIWGAYYDDDEDD